MKFYLETNAIRHLASKLTQLDENSFTSHLVVFELLSGIKDCETFNTRKVIIDKLYKSGLRIDWSTFKERIHGAHKIPFFDKERNVTKIMASIALESNSYNEMLQVEREKEFQYSIESFRLQDEEISKLGIEESKNHIQHFGQSNGKEERKEIRRMMFDDSYIYSYAQTHKEIVHMNIIKDMTETSRILMRELYLKYLEDYDRSLDSYFYSVSYNHLYMALKGEECAKNDTIDLEHLIYVDDETTIVSDDGIFEKINQNQSVFKTMKISEYIEMHKIK